MAAQDKPIRLRAATLTPNALSQPAGFANTTITNRTFSGLFLVQFQHRLTPNVRDALRKLGVDLICYVPEDAFVARSEQVTLDQLRTLPAIRWAGDYEPGYKIDPSLNPTPALRTATEQIAVSLLLAPGAKPGEIVAAQRSLRQPAPLARYRFGVILRGRVARGQLPALAASPGVLWVEPAPRMQLYDEVSSKIVAGEGAGHHTAMTDLGYDGAGVTVAVADSGLNNGDAATMHPDLFGRVTAFFHYGALTDAADEHSHGTHVAGIIGGDGAVGETDDDGALYGLGVAPKVNIIAQRIFDGAGNYEAPATSETLTRDAKTAGADIGSNSWGDDTQGRYDLSAAEFDGLVRDADALTPGDQAYILEFSAGNAGPGRQTIGSPAVAKNVIATGASQNDRFGFFLYEEGHEAMADFSSRGPCEDGRIKPDVVAPGTWIASLKSASASDENAWAPISENYLYQGGTSQAGPQVSGAAAIFVQYYRTQYGATPSPALVKAALINSAVDMDDSAGTDPIPNKDEGWGRVDLTRLIGSARNYDFVDQTERLTTGQTTEHRVVIGGAEEPLKITLAYTDVPAFAGAVPALVNDLDLEVIGPDGTVYHGNQLDAGQSIANALAWDRLNNVEAVHLATPQPGEYIIRVHAENVVQDALQETPGTVDQDFALVVSGSFLPPGIAAVFLDRPVYNAPDLIQVTLLDPDLAGLPTALVRLSSATEPSGESLLVFPAGGAGIFTNALPTATGAPAPDGRLQVAHDDTIEVRYEDASSGATRTATARVDLLPPVLTNVTTTNRFGRTIIQWNTDESADSRVYFGTNMVLNLSATNRFFTTQHEVGLENLVPRQTYYFAVASTDPVGNAATNDNHGNRFSFVARETPAVLLVDSIISGADLFEPPLFKYTQPLDELGVDYDLWRVETDGSPQAADLRPYRVVIWRLPEGSFAEPTWTPAERQAIREYLDGGGSLFVASMEVLSRLDTEGASDFRETVLQVPAFAEDAGVSGVNGIATDPITTGLSLDLDYEDYIGFDFSDTITPSTNAAGIFLDTGLGDYAGLKYPRTGVDSPWRLVFLSFPFDAVVNSGPVNSRAGLLRRILTFLAPGLNGEGSLAFDRTAYTVPSLVTVEVADSDLTGAGQFSITMHSSTEPAGQTIQVTETVRPGVFRGAIALSPVTEAAAAGHLRAQDGDLVWGRYFDASAGQTIETSVPVDTQPATISSVTHEADYVAAFVRWETSEPTDGLVQYGESLTLPIFRTAYESRLQTSHELLLTGLQPDRKYDYRVISRDAAGNTVMDDNTGEFYSFRTLVPINPPWTDDLESSVNNWSAIDGEISQTVWTLGSPNNSQETAAHSPVNAWGSNLSGLGLDYAETWLFSPAIDLTRANQATLRFWQSYDFTAGANLDAIEGGELWLYTNLFSEPITLLSLTDATPGWEEATLDLSAYSGQVVFLAYYYVYFNLFLDNPHPPGWLIDDISLTASTVLPGTIRIANNLAQANYVLTGPTSRSGQGWGITLTNALPGHYWIRYGDVPFYATPAPQTNDLAAQATITFQGTYTLVDTNHNGMADAWEQSFFNEVSPARTLSTDTDHDGFTDYAEFIAGTNPMAPDSNLELTEPEPLPDGRIRLTWPTVPGRAYRVEGTGDLVLWLPLSLWQRAETTNLTITLPPDAVRWAFLFRLQVQP